tara:strand:- start:82 stop:1170 length:1089 start_codon:yes stop_codon:yes gene_type:complete
MKKREHFIFGNALKNLYRDAKDNQYAIPAVNVIGTNSVNAVLEAAKEVCSPVIIQLSYSGAAFFIGKGCGLSGTEASVEGAVFAAKYIRNAANIYNVDVVIHTDHASKKLLPWIDGLLAAGQEYFKETGKPLFSSHMLDFSEEPLKENISLSANYLKKLTALDMLLEIELGCTGGEEDGVDNTHIDNAKLYTQPEDVAYAYEQLIGISSNFTVAAAFGNVHGVYKSGQVKLTPKILANSQSYLSEKFNLPPNPLSFVFHGGSGSKIYHIHEAIYYGTVKMNIDTDTQWSFWQGIKDYYQSKANYLQSQLGNPIGLEQPNKKYYDPRVWLRFSEEYMKNRLVKCFENLNCINRSAPKIEKSKF